MVVFIEIVLYCIAVIITVLWVIPMLLYIWGKMFMEGIMISFFKLLNKYKNQKNEKEEKK